MRRIWVCVARAVDKKSVDSWIDPSAFHWFGINSNIRYAKISAGQKRLDFRDLRNSKTQFFFVLQKRLNTSRGKDPEEPNWSLQNLDFPLQKPRPDSATTQTVISISTPLRLLSKISTPNQSTTFILMLKTLQEHTCKSTPFWCIETRLVSHKSQDCPRTSSRPKR